MAPVRAPERILASPMTAAMRRCPSRRRRRPPLCFCWAAEGRTPPRRHSNERTPPGSGGGVEGEEAAAEGHWELEAAVRAAQERAAEVAAGSRLEASKTADEAAAAARREALDALTQLMAGSSSTLEARLSPLWSLLYPTGERSIRPIMLNPSIEKLDGLGEHRPSP